MASRGGAFAAGALFLLLELALQGAAEPPLVPAMFVFGDSLVDVGNNNHLARCNASCRADYPRYGVDHPCHSPTGRFSNGYNLADQLAQLLGFPESPPPLLSLLKARLVPQMSSGGINFASGGAGLLDRTGPRVCGGEVLSMTAQVGNFTSLARRWRRENRTTAADLISRSLFFISVGSNDLFEHIDFPSAPNRNDIRFLQDLVASYTSYDLYAAGARKFSAVSPSLVGCCPSQRALAHDPSKGPIGVDKFGCLGAANNLSRQLHPMVADMLQGLSLELPRMNYSLGDAVGMAEFVFNSPSTPAYKFTELERACCGSGEFGEGGCNGSAPLCGNRSSYVFWDRFHPTEAASAVTAKELFVRPINVQQLVAPQP